MCSPGVTAAAFLPRESMCKCEAEPILQRMQPQEFDAVYELMQQSFPPDEIRPAQGQSALFAYPEYQVMVSHDSAGAVAGMMAVWQFPDFVFLEHFAVSPACRGCGWGTRMLQALLREWAKPVCLEVELPQAMMARRRIAFYERNGFCLNDYDYIQPPMAEGQQSVPLRIMSRGSRLNAEQFEALRDTLYRVVYPLSATM